MFRLNLSGISTNQADSQKSSNEIKFRGVVDEIFWEDEKSSRFGFHFRPNEKAPVPTRSGTKFRRDFVCFAQMKECVEDTYLEISGNWNPIREDRDEAVFSAKSCLYVDDDEDGAKAMLRFCFGPATSLKIIAEGFDDDAMEAWTCFRDDEDAFISKIEDVKGVGPKRVRVAREKYEDHMAMEVLYTKFKRYGLSLAQALKVYDKYGTRTQANMEKNPYCISKYTGFTVADNIALKKYNVSLTDERRVIAGIMTVMHSQEQEGGHVFMRLSKPVGNVKTLLQATSYLLKGKSHEPFPEAVILDGVVTLEEKKKLIMDKQQGEDIVYLPKFYHAEVNLAKRLKTMIGDSGISDELIDSYIDAYQEKKKIELNIPKFELADLQRQAVHTAVKNQFSIISGPPGSGKTTIIDCIVSILKQLNRNCNIALCAPTGKAAKRMTESTGLPASTVHRLLHFDPETKDFSYNEENPLDQDVIIADECSMMGLCLCDSLIAAVKPHAKVIFVGDKDQLPSVDAGKVLADLLAVKAIPKVILNKVYRQKEGSTILQRALILTGADGNPRCPDLSDAQDFQFYEYDNLEIIKAGCADLYAQEVEKYGIDNVLFLIPQNKGEIGVNVMNNILQEKVNPDPNHTKAFVKIGANRVFRMGDRVIQMVNEDEYEVFNGMIGTIVEIFKDPESDRDTISVDFGDDLVVDYQRDRFDNIKLAYALTIHKCQGSEAKSVIMLTVPEHAYMSTTKLIYTGWTRAKEILHLVGSKQTVFYASQRKEAPRLSKLTSRLAC